MQPDFILQANYSTTQFPGFGKWQLLWQNLYKWNALPLPLPSLNEQCYSAEGRLTVLLTA